MCIIAKVKLFPPKLPGILTMFVLVTITYYESGSILSALKQMYFISPSNEFYKVKASILPILPMRKLKMLVTWAGSSGE